MDQDLRAIGIDLDAEFDELSREVPVSTDHQKGWRADTRELFALCRDMGLSPRPTPKLIDSRKCRRCGRCILGCPTGAKWDARVFVDQAVSRGRSCSWTAAAWTACRSRAARNGVWAVRGGAGSFMPADLVVLAAGGPGHPRHPPELRALPCDERLFVDPVLCLAGRREGTGPRGEISMPFVVQGDSYILSPYFDYLSFFYNRRLAPAGVEHPFPHGQACG